ncbi:aspartate aminotransferase [Ahrensia sp. R2A130]|nr:aspartate aminotransferase [Ahrensia sp. R2A130]
MKPPCRWPTGSVVPSSRSANSPGMPCPTVVLRVRVRPFECVWQAYRDLAGNPVAV